MGDMRNATDKYEHGPAFRADPILEPVIGLSSHLFSSSAIFLHEDSKSDPIG